MTDDNQHRRAARARWGPPRRLAVGDLTEAQRELVEALISAQRAANACKQQHVKDNDTA